jgi:hypothetical protein
MRNAEGAAGDSPPKSLCSLSPRLALPKEKIAPALKKDRLEAHATLQRGCLIRVPEGSGHER